MAGVPCWVRAERDGRGLVVVKAWRFVGVGDREAVRDAGRVGMATHSQESIGHPMNIPTITCPSAIHQAVSAYACSSPARSLGSVGLCSMFSD